MTQWTVAVSRPALVVALLVSTLAGCDKPRAYRGIGDWELGVTKLAQALDYNWICPRDQVKRAYCTGSPIQVGSTVALGEQNGHAGLLFDGVVRDSVLVEIVLSVDDCNEYNLRIWLQQKFGAASGSGDALAYWRGPYMFIGARLPAEKGLCEVSFVLAEDKARIDALTQSR